ncbi:MAG: acyl-CoA reductase [Chitinophagaceae bacterium]|nr:acyl-CoA reductase [Chitinophagaceae bacterium]
MNLAERIDLLVMLGEYLTTNTDEWQEIKQKAFEKNNWFTHEFVDLAVKNIVEKFLKKDKLLQLAKHYHLDDNIQQKNIGIVAAGNIPLVCFHDFLCVFITCHKITLKLSSKDDVLLKYFVQKMTALQPEIKDQIFFADILKNCDAYIATGSNNSARYFDYYFGKYPSIIKKNKTSVAILSGKETNEELTLLADDIQQYFGLGCRNVTKIYVPEKYDFVTLLTALKKYDHFIDHNKYKNNYDYCLTLQIMNNSFYMTNDSVLLIENDQLFSSISSVHYSFYTNLDLLKNDLANNPDIQCIEGAGTPFGKAQQPGLFDFADGVDTIQFLLAL